MWETNIQAEDKFKLTNLAIEAIVENVSFFLRKYQIEQKEILRTTLTLEDTLLNYQDFLGEKTVCSLKCVHRFGRIRIELTVHGENYNPFASGDDEDFSRILLSGIGMAPAWQYRNGQNIVIFSPKKKQRSSQASLA